MEWVYQLGKFKLGANFQFFPKNFTGSIKDLPSLHSNLVCSLVLYSILVDQNLSFFEIYIKGTNFMNFTHTDLRA